MAIESLLGANPKVEKIASGFEFSEGPVFSRIGYLLFSDIPRNRVIKWRPGGAAATVFRENSNGANGLTFDHQGRLLICERNRLLRIEKDESVTTLADKFEGKGLLSPNDVVYSIDGSVYFSVLRPRNAAADPASIDFSAVFQVTRKAELRLASKDCERPNGVALSANQQQLFVADSGQRNVRVFDIAGDGRLRNGRVFCELKSETPGVPDGLKTDEAGHVWVAGPGGVWVFDGKGQHLGTVAVPETPSNCGWGDGFRSLYITARTSVYRVETKVNGTRTY